ncbi:hypothetical protein D3C87_1598820 [compost metagenome]
MPSSTLPSTMKARMETTMKVFFPPGSPFMNSASSLEKPDWVNAHAIADAAPMMRRIAPERMTVSTSMGPSRRQSNWRYNARPTKIE